MAAHTLQHQKDTPEDDVHTQILAHGKLLEEKVCRYAPNQKAKVEDT